MQLETKPLETQRGAYDQAPRKFDFDKDGVGRDMGWVQRFSDPAGDWMSKVMVITC